jgi:hypothetical protein
MQRRNAAAKRSGARRSRRSVVLGVDVVIG